MKNRFTVLLWVAFWCMGAQANEKNFRVLTYNVGLLRALGSDIVKNVDGRAAKLPPRLAELAHQRDLDVLLLQEVWESSHAEAITQALGDSFVTRWPKDQVAFGNTSGLFLAVRKSSFELDEKEGGLKRFSNAEKAGLEKMSAKGTLVMRLLSPGTDLPPIALMGTHLQCLKVDTQSGTATDKAEILAHSAQADRLSLLTDDLNKAGLPVLVLGDFNVGPVLGRNQYELLVKKLSAQNALYTLSPGAKAISWDQENPLIQSGHFPDDPSDLVDHVFYRSAHSGTLTPTHAEIVLQEKDSELDSPLSDHYGVLVELRLEN